MTAAKCSITPAANAWKAVISTFDRPGQVVKRCLLDQLRDIWVEFEDGARFRGEIERVYYDPKQGRVCTVRLCTTAPLVSTSAPSGQTAVRSPLAV